MISLDHPDNDGIARHMRNEHGDTVEYTMTVSPAELLRVHRNVHEQFGSDTKIVHEHKAKEHKAE